MNHGFKLLDDKTLAITIPKGIEVGRVLIQEDNTHDGKLYYSDGLLEQYKWERDVAISQLKDLGYGLGEKPRKGDLINKKAVDEWLKQYGQDCLHGKYKFSPMYIWKNLMALPSAEPERKKGGWIFSTNSPSGESCYVCNQCGAKLDSRYANFCSNCGTDMRQLTERMNHE